MPNKSIRHADERQTMHIHIIIEIWMDIMKPNYLVGNKDYLFN